MMVCKVALVGCGNWGKNIARNLHALGALHLIVDPSEAAATMAGTLGVGVVDTLDEALAMDTVSAVAIATPAITHFALASQAMLAGRHAYVEKPIALSTEEGRELGAIAKRTSRVLMVGHLLQYHPVFLKLKQLVADGVLGKVRYISSSRLSLGMIRVEENVIWSFSPHDISMVLGLSGAPPEKVSAFESFVLPQQISDMGTVHLSWADGLRADITSSWYFPQKEQKLVVVGDEAMAVFSDTQPWEQKLLLYRNGVDYSSGVPKAVKNEAEEVEVPHGEPLLMEMQHFLDCVERAERPRTDADEAVRVLAVLQAAEASLAQANEWVTTSQFLD
jgi:UDP-2-acetamido-3-amino-2,3-dideoxy-glucuronate N-acetyltransferase